MVFEGVIIGLFVRGYCGICVGWEIVMLIFLFFVCSFGGVCGFDGFEICGFLLVVFCFDFGGDFFCFGNLVVVCFFVFVIDLVGGDWFIFFLFFVFI